jgi:hypothetical protein
MTTGRRGAASSAEDELLSRLYQQITDRHVARSAAGYDVAAGLDRYRAWLGEHAAEEYSKPRAIHRQGSAAPRVGLADSGAGIVAAATSASAVAVGTTQGSTGTVSGTLAIAADWEAEQAVTAMYSTHYRSLVRLAALLVRDNATAEEVVQDSFVAMQARARHAQRRAGRADLAGAHGRGHRPALAATAPA